jgi:hypothetical protein
MFYTNFCAGNSFILWNFSLVASGQFSKVSDFGAVLIFWIRDIQPVLKSAQITQKKA